MSAIRGPAVNGTLDVYRISRALDAETAGIRILRMIHDVKEGERVVTHIFTLPLEQNIVGYNSQRCMRPEVRI
jgi:hypothetical protein